MALTGSFADLRCAQNTCHLPVPFSAGKQGGGPLGPTPTLICGLLSMEGQHILLLSDCPHCLLTLSWVLISSRLQHTAGTASSAGLGVLLQHYIHSGFNCSLRHRNLHGRVIHKTVECFLSSLYMKCLHFLF